MSIGTVTPARDVDLASALLEFTDPMRRTLRRTPRGDRPEDALPRAQLELLDVVDRNPGVGVRAAAAFLQLAPNSVSTLVNQLAAVGLLAKERDPDDGRSVRLWMTPEADVLVRSRHAFRRQAVSAALSRLPAGDRRRIGDALPALRRLLGELGGRR